MASSAGTSERVRRVLVHCGCGARLGRFTYRLPAQDQALQVVTLREVRRFAGAFEVTPGAGVRNADRRRPARRCPEFTLGWLLDQRSPRYVWTCPKGHTVRRQNLNLAEELKDLGDDDKLWLA